MAHPGQLQEWQGYQRIGLDVRIPKIPNFPVFRIRFGQKSGKTVFPFCSFVAYTGQLQKWQGYPRIRLDLRIPTVPIFPVFWIWFGRKSRKTAFPLCSIVDQLGYRLDLRIPTVPIFSVFRIQFGRKSGKKVQKKWFIRLALLWFTQGTLREVRHKNKG